MKPLTHKERGTAPEEPSGENLLGGVGVRWGGGVGGGFRQV